MTSTSVAPRLGLDERRVQDEQAARREERLELRHRRRVERDDAVGAVDDRRADRVVGDDDRARRRPAAHLRAVGRHPRHVAALEDRRLGEDLAGEQEALPAEARRRSSRVPSVSPPRSDGAAAPPAAPSGRRWTPERIGLDDVPGEVLHRLGRRSCPSRPGRSDRTSTIDSPPPASWISNARRSIAFVLPDAAGSAIEPRAAYGDAGQQREHLGDRERVAGRQRRRGRSGSTSSAGRAASSAPSGRRSSRRCRC